AGLAGLGDGTRPPERSDLVGRLLGWQGRFCLFLGQPDRAGALLERSRALLETPVAGAALALTLTSLARLAAGRGAMAEADRLDRETAAVGRAAGARYVYRALHARRDTLLELIDATAG